MVIPAMDQPRLPENETSNLVMLYESPLLDTKPETDAVFEKRLREQSRDLAKANRILRRQLIELKRAEDAARSLNVQLERQLHRADVLRHVDRAITHCPDLKLNLEIVIEQTMGHLGIDALDILLCDPHTQSLEYIAGKGFSTTSPSPKALRLQCGPAARAVLQGDRVQISRLVAESAGLPKEWVTDEGFVYYLGVPLKVNGQVNGVLELFHRSIVEPDGEWISFVETIADQASIAIHNATILDRVQRSNRELTRAYDATIEGWSHALDLRDKETEGHTKRVTEMTVRLARAMGVDEADLVHVRRGALLHDIGKMVVPDDILFKPGPLTTDEWEIIRRHPVHAYDMLSPIEYLRSALDIPYAHHEKWDGSGYPRALCKEQIPLAARIFAVVDVWDRLRSNRPYRPGWPEDRVRRHIRSLAGTHFDPKVAETFLQLLATSITPDPMTSVDIYKTWAADDPRPPDEYARLEALQSYPMLDTPSEPTFDELAKLAAGLCGASMAGIALVDSTRQWFKSNYGFELVETPKEGSLCAHVVATGDTLVIADASQEPCFAECPLVRGGPSARFFAGTPLITPSGLALGALFIMDSCSRELLPFQREALESLGRQVMALMELKRTALTGRQSRSATETIGPQVVEQLRLAREYNIELEQQQQQLLQTNARLAELVTTDNLTGLKNQGYFREVLEASFSFSMRRGLPLSVVMLDVDHFKSYNDTFGHPIGDEVLRQVSDLLNESARAEDLVARYGGEEFVVLLPATDSRGAIDVAERMREAIETHPWSKRGVTASLGIATICPSTLYASSLVEEADRALYLSKAQGRNRVTHSDEVLDQAA